MNIKGKKALVFGGTSGIGLAASLALAEKGAKVVAISRSPERARDALPATVELGACDVRDRDAMSALFAQHAPFDILVSAATGGDRAAGPFMEMDLDGFQGSFDKLWGYANCVRLGAGHLTDSGCIVLVSGIPARNPKPGQIAIGAVGAAVESFARSAAREIAPLRLNVVAPGVIDTPMFGPASEKRSASLDGATSGHPIPRPGQPDEVANGIVFVIENDFVTGTTVDVDGGWAVS
ncbi:MAG: NAD(P)-dependent dehydrogenase (short-subunit alcohol dehydrogenase family) [Gammaproteobacteria bacterium]